MKDNEDYKEFIKIFKRVQYNPIYFLDLYYKIVHPDKSIELTDEEKQELFDEFHSKKGIPLITDVKDWELVRKHEEQIKKYKEEGYKDWEIL